LRLGQQRLTLLQDPRQNTVQLIRRLIDSESNQLESFAIEVPRSLLIFRPPLVVMRSIDFDDQASRWTVEINNVGTDRSLSPEFVAAELASAEPGPEQPFDPCLFFDGALASFACGDVIRQASSAKRSAGIMAVNEWSTVPPTLPSHFRKEGFQSG
jgi:hypothetical protein